ncbi:response regulator transcription factor [Phototrophicus methaneseepsis]|uniref:Response regulator transcription factor n=1 Tax=Phototrophicus methaneseepsis TaxID=2710758 RepID=A0A7S8E5D4_9CHLR|nr:response regulator transcription factor [Phototrophicus methaneseepsis]QPC80679.1 response regulator transcription factor [Phototrophicus methaneseepsis]
MSTQASVLIIEDDRELSRLLQIDLQRHNFDVSVTNNGLDGLRMFQNSRHDLVVLDVALPLMDGLTVCERIREISNVPILMMTAHAVSEHDIAEGLNRGADEYMLKPLGKIEFHARIKALLRRARISEEPAETITRFEDGYLSVDLNTRRVLINGEEIRLTPTEFKLLATFIRNPDAVLSFQQLLETVWGPEYNSEHHYPRIYVSHLRRKIEPDAKNPSYIHNEYGVGYRFVGQNEAVQ